MALGSAINFIEFWFSIAILLSEILCDPGNLSNSRWYTNSFGPSETDLCAIDTPTVTLPAGLSVGRCAVECNRLRDCNWFNYIDHEAVGGYFSSSTACQLFSFPPVTLDIVSGCVLHYVSTVLHEY
jgi:hypothetical protein